MERVPPGPPIDLKKAAKDKKKDELKKNAYNRKITNQYEYLKKWDRGEITGMEACEAIELEGKVFRLESDLIKANGVPPTEPKGIS
jgi:hypothetical protein